MNGDAGSTNIGGGSGGHIHIITSELEGSGSIEVVGGSGGSYAGGGGGGRIIIDHHSTRYWFGLLDARGGSGYRAGGAGTVLLEVGHVRIQRGGQGVLNPPPTPTPPLKNHQNTGFLCNTGPNPMKNNKATKPAFNVGPSSARQQNAI